LGDYPGAVDDFGRAIQLSPTDAANHEARGWACVACGAYQLAVPDFEEAIRLDRRKGDAYKAALGGGVLVGLPIRLDRSRADAFTGGGYARVKLGKEQEGIQDAETAMGVGPQTPRLLHDAARIYVQAAARTDEQRLDRAAQERRFRYE